MFGIDFYPTPKNVIEQMIFWGDVKGKNFLEPSAGKGNIVDYLNEHGANSVLACEIDNNLRAILQGKCEIIASNFLDVTSDMVSHIDYIIMNPPFSSYAKHINHAWDIAPEGCQIVALCNMETYKYNLDRELCNTVKNYGDIIELGSCFDTAERKTDVNIGMIKLFKPAHSKSFDYNGFYLDEESINLTEENGIIKRNEVKILVEHYVRSLRVFDELRECGDVIEEYMKSLGCYSPKIQINLSYNENVTTKEEFARKLQIQAWNKVFELTKIEKFITSNIREDINRFVGQYSKYPFSVKNIYRMLEILLASRKNIMDTAVERAIDDYTKHTHENRHDVEGWKTNSGYMLNKKFISNYGVEYSVYGGLSLRYGGNASENIGNLEKAICYIQGYNWELLHDSKEEWERRCREVGRVVETRKCSLYDYFYNNKVEAGVWYDWGLFRFKAFKKGTIHFQFKNDADWEAINRAYAKIKGQSLPEKL